jgi:hypothetical protein
MHVDTRKGGEMQMATRGAVGVVISREPLRWIGVCNYWDSYPSVLLRTILEEVLPACNYDSMEAVKGIVLDHPGGWVHLHRSGVILPDPDNPRGFLYKEGADAPQCRCHSEYFLKLDGFTSGLLWGCDCQGSASDSEKPKCNPLHIEWVYLFDVVKGTILVLASRECGKSCYRHEIIAEVPVKGAGTIDYDALEKQRW